MTQTASSLPDLNAEALQAINALQELDADATPSKKKYHVRKHDFIQVRYFKIFDETALAEIRAQASINGISEPRAAQDFLDRAVDAYVGRVSQQDASAVLLRETGFQAEDLARAALRILKRTRSKKQPKTPTIKIVDNPFEIE